MSKNACGASGEALIDEFLVEMALIVAAAWWFPLQGCKGLTIRDRNSRNADRAGDHDY